MRKFTETRDLLLIVVVTFTSITLVIWLNADTNLSQVTPKRSSLQRDDKLARDNVLGRGLPRSRSNVSGHHDAERAKRTPKAIIIGSRKSGTRALLKFLELNPSVYAAHSEVHFFDNNQNFLKGLDWYRSQMPETKRTEVAIEKSPAYFVSSQAPERIKCMNSSIKLILIMRDPVTRLISDFSQLVANRYELDSGGRAGSTSLDNGSLPKNTTTGEDKIWTDAEKEFEQYVLRPDGGIDEQRRAIRSGMYSTFLERWLAQFAREQFHFVDGEKLVTSPYEIMVELERFLGLEARIRRGQFVFNPKKGFYCIVPDVHPTDQRGQEVQASLRPNSNHPKEPQHVCLSKSKGRRHVKVNRQLLERLHAFYAPYNEYLFTMTGINFNAK